MPDATSIRVGDRVRILPAWDSRHGETGIARRIDDGLYWVDFREAGPLAAYDKTELEKTNE